jgi:hypothetical protein
MTSGTRSIRARHDGMAAIILKGSTLQVQYFAEFPCPSVEIRVPYIERFFLSRKIALELGLTLETMRQRRESSSKKIAATPAP